MRCLLYSSTSRLIDSRQLWDYLTIPGVMTMPSTTPLSSADVPAKMTPPPMRLAVATMCLASTSFLWNSASETPTTFAQLDERFRRVRPRSSVTRQLAHCGSASPAPYS